MTSLGNLIGEKFGSVTDEKDKCEGGAEGVALTELGDEFLHAETVVFFDLVEELHCVELSDDYKIIMKQVLLMNE